MVGSASGLGRNGVQDFVLIRATGVVMALYTIYLLFSFATQDFSSYQNWVAFWDCLPTKVFTALALLAVLIHAWIGLWQVLTDYIKPAFARGVLQFVVTLTAFAYLFIGLAVVWGV